jgi:hypothetical protein
MWAARATVIQDKHIARTVRGHRWAVSRRGDARLFVQLQVAPGAVVPLPPFYATPWVSS